MRKAAARCAAVIAAVLAAGAVASVPSLDECVEGSDFIGNAAQARDNGVTREAFLDRLRDDLESIRAFPPALRWFARDPDDETFLYGAAERVFRAPSTPAVHRRAFLLACLERVGTPSIAPAPPLPETENPAPDGGDGQAAARPIFSSSFSS